MTSNREGGPNSQPDALKRGEDGRWYALFRAPLPDGGSTLRYVVADTASGAVAARRRAQAGEPEPSWRLSISPRPPGPSEGHRSSGTARPPGRYGGDRRVPILLGVFFLVAALILGFPLRAKADRVSRRPREDLSQMKPVADVFTSAPVETYLASRSGTTTAAVIDLATNQTFLLAPSVTESTASIMKVDILAALLYDSQQDGQPLTTSEQQLATTMIENSDDDSATALWGYAGGNAGMDAFNKAIGLDHTVMGPPDLWGLSTTTAADQVTLLRQVVSADSVLTPASRQYELGLMENVEADQTWGISTGVPSGVTVAIKDGWDNLGTGTNWQINTEGWVDGDGRDYLIAVLTQNEPDEYDAIQTVDQVSNLVWTAMAPAG